MVSRFGPSTADPSSLSARCMRWHAILYAVVIAGLNTLNVVQGAPWWAIWPTLTWGVVLAIHWFIYKAMNVDEAWVNERASEIREYSYDIDHMKDMQQRITHDHYSLRPHSDESKRDTEKPRDG